jgi:hypothetical protein
MVVGDEDWELGRLSKTTKSDDDRPPPQSKDPQTPSNAVHLSTYIT